MNLESTITKSADMMKLAEDIAVHLEAATETLPDGESIDLEMRINAGTALVSDMAGACGELDRRTAYYKIGRVRSQLFEIIALLKLAHRLRKIQLQPELMLEMRKLIRLIDAEAATMHRDEKI